MSTYKQPLDTSQAIVDAALGECHRRAPNSFAPIHFVKENDDLTLTSFPRLIAFLGLFIALPAASISAQIPAGSSARTIPTEVEKSDPLVSRIIARAEDHFRKGKLNLEDNKREQARDEFDKAVDSILESGLDVRASQRLQTFYLELVERIYREEVPVAHGPMQTAVAELVAQNAQSGTAEPQKGQPQIGFREQKFEPSPLDELSKLVLTPDEQNVSDSDVLALEQASCQQ